MNSINEITGFLEHLAEAILIADADSGIVFANAACSDLFGYHKEEMKQLRLDDLMEKSQTPNHPELVREFIQTRSAAKEMQARSTITCKNSEGNHFHARISIAPTKIAEELYGVATIQDFTPIHHELETMEILSTIDALTNLHNRHYLDMVTKPDSRILESWTTIGVLFLDMDKFKPVNDKYGHKTGDKVLRAVAQRLIENFRFDDLSFRVGGDEFLVLCNLSNIPKPRAVLELLVKNIHHHLSRPIVIKDHTLQLDVSIGAGIYPDDGSDLVEIINLADKAMYLSKNNSDTITFIN